MGRRIAQQTTASSAPIEFAPGDGMIARPRGHDRDRSATTRVTCNRSD
jgi:hypothetical protein